MEVLHSVVTETRGCGACGEGTEYSLEMMEDGTVRRWVDGCDGMVWENRLAQRGEVVSTQDAIEELEDAFSDQLETISELEEKIELIKEEIREATEMINALKQT